MDLKGKTALVTGASSGMGASFAELLAGMGADLVITARRVERLEKLASEIKAKHAVKVTVYPADLQKRRSVAELFALTEGAGNPVEIVINNAGFPSRGPFVDTEWEKLEGQIRLNIMALTEMTHKFSKIMADRGHGYILNVASFAAYLPIPNYAVYSASKAYVRNFTEAVACEMSGSGVHLCSLCPGQVETEFWNVAGQRPPMHALTDSPDFVAGVGLQALFAGKTNVVAGAMNDVSTRFLKFMPKGLAMRIAAKIAMKE